MWPSSWYATNLLGGGCQLQIGTRHAHLPSTSICIYLLAPQSCLTLCDPMDCSPLGSSVHGSLQARILERVAMTSSSGSSPPRDPTCISCLLNWQAGSLPLAPPGKHKVWWGVILKDPPLTQASVRLFGALFSTQPCP